MQTGKDGGALRAADGQDIEEVLADALAEMDELLASVALEPPHPPPECDNPPPASSAPLLQLAHVQV